MNCSYGHSIGTLKEALGEDVQGPLDSAVSWIEFAGRHRGASVLKHDPEANQNLISYLCLDAWLLALCGMLATATAAKKLVAILIFPVRATKLKTQ